MPAQQTVTDLVTSDERGPQRLQKVSGGRSARRVRDEGGAAAHHRPQVGPAAHGVAHLAGHDAERIVLIASKGGDDRHPDWYHNVVAHPESRSPTATSPSRTGPHRHAEEKAELWPQVVAAYKGYAGYQKRTERDIPWSSASPRRR